MVRRVNASSAANVSRHVRSIFCSFSYYNEYKTGECEMRRTSDGHKGRESGSGDSAPRRCGSGKAAGTACVPDFAVVVGSPAKVVKTLDESRFENED